MTEYLQKWCQLLSASRSNCYLAKVITGKFSDFMTSSWAHLCICTVGSYASLSVCNLTKIQTWPKVTRPKVFGFIKGQNGSPVRALNNWQTDRQTGPILYPRPLAREGKTMCFIQTVHNNQIVCMVDIWSENVTFWCSIHCQKIPTNVWCPNRWHYYT